jgi:hypothetical protein
MRRLLSMGLAALVVVTLAACGGKESKTDGQGDSQLGLIDWSRDPNTIIVRLDAQSSLDDPAFTLNNIPPCTLWGDGRVVWASTDDYGSEQILEARLDDVTIRTFLEDIISRGFYSWQDELLPMSSSNPVTQSLTVFLYDELRTVRRYTAWPENSYNKIMDRCSHLSSAPVLVLPQVGWISAYAIPRDDSAPSWLWPLSAPFTLRDLAQNGEARWLEGALASEIWLNVRERSGETQVVERDNSAYRVAIVVPGYSRDTVAPPSDTAADGGS